MIALPARLRRPLIWAGYPAFALLVAIVTLYATLPRDRIKERLESALSSDPSSGGLAIGMDVTIDDVGLTLLTGLGIKATSITVRSRPPNPNDKPARYFVDDVTVRSGLLGLMFGRPTYRWKAHGLGGAANGEVTPHVDESHVRVEANGIVLNGVQGIQQSVGLPVEGTLSGKFDVTTPKNLAANANGNIEVTLDDAAVGDGKAKLTVPGDPFLSQGVTFPKLRFGKVSGQLVIEKGRARLEGFAVHSADGDATLEGYIELRDPVSMSQMHAYLKFRPTEALLKREATVELMNNALGAMAKRPDGYIGFQLTGPLSAVFFMPSKEPPAGVTSHALPTGAPAPMPAAPTLPPPTILPPPPSSMPSAAPPYQPPPSAMPQPQQNSDDREPAQLPPPPQVRSNLNKALEELNNHHEGDTVPAPPPSPEGLPANQRGE